MPLLASAALWRAMFLMGYGPTPWLVQALAQAGSPRDWALQQVNADYAARQQNEGLLFGQT